jgi:hypothetical protein
MASSSRGVAVDLEGTSFCFVGVAGCLDFEYRAELGILGKHGGI